MRRLLLVLLVVAGATLLARGAVPCAAVGLQPACYVALRPGPTVDTAQLVEFGDTRTFAPSGELVLTTVAVDVDLDLDAWVRGAFSSRVQQVPREALFPPGDDSGDISQRNASLMVGSQVDATVAALRALDYEVDTDFAGAEVEGIEERSAVADGELERGDVIVGIDDEPVEDNRDAVDLLAEYDPGDEVTFEVERDGRSREVTVELIESEETPGQAQVGVTLVSHIDLPVDIDIDAGSVGGPSAGLMFSLSIIELLEEDDLTGGAVIAGTGTISQEGEIGPIGGIRQKILGATARDEGERPAGVFLVPEDNLAEARHAEVPREILLVPVGTLDDALAALEDLRDGREPDDALALGAR